MNTARGDRGGHPRPPSPFPHSRRPTDSHSVPDRLAFYIDGQWVEPIGTDRLDVINPATEDSLGKIGLGNKADIDRAVAAARNAFTSFSRTSVRERAELLEAILEAYVRRADDLAEMLSKEIGAPHWLAGSVHVASGAAHLEEMLSTLDRFEFASNRGATSIFHEPIGVCGLITPWNWPVSQIICKVAPALAAGCTAVLKPSESAPFGAMMLADIFHEAGVPAGVINVVNGEGRTAGAELAGHPDIDMISFTGSTAAGISVAKRAADTVKRVVQELGGNSAYIILDDIELEEPVVRCVMNAMVNSGQSCNAPRRMLVPRNRFEKAIAIARATVASIRVGDPLAVDTVVGPVATKTVFDAVNRLIEQALERGTRLVCGGPGRPAGLARGYYVRPTVFAAVTAEMSSGRDEIFGPVLSVIPYDGVEDAIRIANDTWFGLAGYVEGGDPENTRKLARRLRTGIVHLNGAGTDFGAPFGGYRHSGNGREWGEYGLREYLEVKSVLGYATPAATPAATATTTNLPAN